MAATLKCDTIQNASSATANITLDTAGNATVGNTLAMGSSFLRNRIINGAMGIDQRNAGASVSATTGGQYFVDRWCTSISAGSKFTAQQSTDAPTGFNNSLLITSSSAWSVGASDYATIQQFIEGVNIADFGFGTGSAKTLTLSFWVKSTGLTYPATLGGVINNGSNASAANRSYPFTFSVSASNTWQQITVTFSGDTAGTWGSSTSNGMGVIISLAAGASTTGTASAWAAANYRGPTGLTNLLATNAATLYITGVQLEVGSVATPFERRQFGTELMLCQRYFYQLTGDTGAGYPGFGVGSVNSSTQSYVVIPLPAAMRAVPTISFGGTVNVFSGSSGVSLSSITTIYGRPNINSIWVVAVHSAGLTTGTACFMYTSNVSSSYFAISAEL